MRASEIMTKGIETVTAASAADEAWALMRMKGIHHLVVKAGGEGGSKLVGLLSDRDLGGLDGDAFRRGRRVEDLMTRDVVMIDASAPVRKAANLMRGRSIGCVVVTTGRRAVGIITIADLLELVGRGLDHPPANTSRTALRHRAPHRKRHQSTGPW